MVQRVLGCEVFMQKLFGKCLGNRYGIGRVKEINFSEEFEPEIQTNRTPMHWFEGRLYPLSFLASMQRAPPSLYWCANPEEKVVMGGLRSLKNWHWYYYPQCCGSESASN
jgi:hypothetical protein